MNRKADLKNKVIIKNIFRVIYVEIVIHSGQLKERRAREGVRKSQRTKKMAKVPFQHHGKIHLCIRI